MTETETTELHHEELPWWKATYEIPVWQWIGVLTTIVLTVFGGILGFGQYLRDRDNQYSVDQVQQCTVILESVSNIKGALTDVYDFIDGARGPSETTDGLRARLEARFPTKSVEQCVKERFG